MLIKLILTESIEDKYNYLDNYIKLKNYLIEEYDQNNENEKNYFPPYACEKCGKYYFHNESNSFPNSIKNCECNSKYYAIYFDKDQKNYIESGRGCAKFSICKYKGKLLEEYKKEFIIEPIIEKCPNLKKLLLNN